MKRSLTLTLGLAAVTGFVSADSTSPKTFRWKDETGATHYSDQVPPDQAKQRRSKLSPQGREIAVIEAAKTPEQLRLEQQLKQLRAQQDKILAEQRDQDLALLRTYRNVEEMYAALKGQLDTLESSSTITAANRERQKVLLANQEQRAADLERQGKPVPDSLKELITATRRQIASYDSRLRDIEKEKAAISERFAKDVDRFKALEAQRRRNTGDHGGSGLTIAAGRAGENDFVISAVACAVGAVCDRAWELARGYVLKSSGKTTLSVDTSRIIQTPNPMADKEFGITVTRIPGRSEDILFLDIRCRPSSIGEELCSSSLIKGIRMNFKTYIEEGLAAQGSAP